MTVTNELLSPGACRGGNTPHNCGGARGQRGPGPGQGKKRGGKRGKREGKRKEKKEKKKKKKEEKKKIKKKKKRSKMKKRDFDCSLKQNASIIFF